MYVYVCMYVIIRLPCTGQILAEFYLYRYIYIYIYIYVSIHICMYLYIYACTTCMYVD